MQNIKKRLRAAARNNPVTAVSLKGLMAAGRAWAGRQRNKKKQVWVFNAGSLFCGNPKWLFIYVNRYRPGIIPIWICDNADTVRQVRELGWRAHLYRSARGIMAQAGADVYCVEQFKENLSPYLPKDVTYLNLFHGVGCKPIEKRLRYGYLVEHVAKKYIQYNEFFWNNTLFLVTSPLMEKHFTLQCGLREEMLIRGGYPRCIYQQQYEPVATFDPDIIRQRNLPADTRIAAYVPTFRDNPEYDFWGNALPDLDALTAVLAKEHILLILKVHPHMQNDPAGKAVRERTKDCPWLMFWDNALDIYEIFPEIDLGIIDYSSMFYDMLAGGVRHFIRYFFDYDAGNMRDFVFDIKEMTCGRECGTFAELLEALQSYGGEDDAADMARISDLFWSYSDEGTMDRIVDKALTYRPAHNTKLPVLYSFGLHETLITGKIPEGAPAFTDEALGQYTKGRWFGRFEAALKKKKQVVLISDTDLDGEAIRRILGRLSPDAADIRMYLKSGTGADKTSKQLYLEAFLGTDGYPYRRWVHIGADPVRDGEIPSQLGIQTVFKKGNLRL